MAEGREEGIWEGEEEVLVGQTSQPPPFQAGSLIILGDCVGVSSGCPYPQEC